MDRENQLVGQSGAFLDAFERASAAAEMNRPVLVIGERGTGKELIAERLHRLSPRWDEPLVTMNCAALPETLIEAELFGHEAGAFTGATKTRAGRFEEADKGTLFLDELGTLSMGAQERLLRAVEYGEVTRIGSSRPLRVDVRIVAATNDDLPALAERGEFRADLLDRLSFEVITLPPLRVRDGDIFLLWPNISGDEWPRSSIGMPGQALRRTLSRSLKTIPGRAMCVSCAMSLSGRSIVGLIPRRRSRMYNLIRLRARGSRLPWRIAPHRLTRRRRFHPLLQAPLSRRKQRISKLSMICERLWMRMSERLLSTHWASIAGTNVRPRRRLA